jgi:GT2 family glycosyltransferase
VIDPAIITDPRGARLCVIVPTWDGWGVLERCLEALERQTLKPQQIIVVDNGSTDGTGAHVAARWPQVQVLELQGNFGFSGGCNRGIGAARPDLDVVLLNNDAQPTPGWLRALDDAAASSPSNVGALASKLIFPDGRLESTGDFLSASGLPFQRGRGELDHGQYDNLTDIFSACGGASLFRRQMLDDVGLLDERFFAYYEDVDLCFRARLAGWRVQLVPQAVVSHAGQATSARIRGFNRYHTARNLWFLLVKNVPGPLLPKLMARASLWHALWLLGALRHGQLRIALSGHVDAARAWRDVLGQRRSIQASRRVKVEDVRAWLPRRAQDLGVTSFGRP